MAKTASKRNANRDLRVIADLEQSVALDSRDTKRVAVSAALFVVGVSCIGVGVYLIRQENQKKQLK